ncbi:flagellar protein [Pelomyxa schiedti]|nr:flagellar protein [Pelomyxa schiedti]
MSSKRTPPPTSSSSSSSSASATASPTSASSSASSSSTTPVYRNVTPAEVLKHTAPSPSFLCPITANSYGIDFTEFCIREVATNTELFHVQKDPDAPPLRLSDLDDSSRFIQYDFGAKFLAYKTIGTKLTFKVGPQPLPTFRMIERHYFKNRLLKSFDFPFGFVIPDSTNEWEVIYDLPRLSKVEQEDIITHPYETKSDSFYFVGDQLVMHNKAEYAYSR